MLNIISCSPNIWHLAIGKILFFLSSIKELRICWLIFSNVPEKPSQGSRIYSWAFRLVPSLLCFVHTSAEWIHGMTSPPAGTPELWVNNGTKTYTWHKQHSWACEISTVFKKYTELLGSKGFTISTPLHVKKWTPQWQRCYKSQDQKSVLKNKNTSWACQATQIQFSFPNG